MREITPEFAAYCAGFFDGEGCVTFIVTNHKHRGKPSGRAMGLRVEISQCDLAILQLLQLNFGGGITKKSHATKSANPRAKDSWVWYCSFQYAVPFLRTIQPYVRVKQRQVDLALQYADYRDTPREIRCRRGARGEGVWILKDESAAKEAEFKTQMSELNRRGVNKSDSPHSGLES